MCGSRNNFTFSAQIDFQNRLIDKHTYKMYYNEITETTEKKLQKQTFLHQHPTHFTKEPYSTSCHIIHQSLMIAVALVPSAEYQNNSHSCPVFSSNDVIWEEKCIRSCNPSVCVPLLQCLFYIVKRNPPKMIGFLLKKVK